MTELGGLIWNDIRNSKYYLDNCKSHEKFRVQGKAEIGFNGSFGRAYTSDQLNWKHTLKVGNDARLELL